MEKKAKKNKEKKKRIFKKIIIILLFLILISFVDATIENIRVEIAINKFINRAVDSYTVEAFDQVRMYHPIAREETYELTDTRSIFYDVQREYLGKAGDIFTTRQSPFPKIFGVHQFVSYYFGGHAAIRDNENGIYEAVGFPDDFSQMIDIISLRGHDPSNAYGATGVKYNADNYWLKKKVTHSSAYDKYYRTEMFGLRVKNVTDDQIQQTLSYVEDHLHQGAVYNFLFFLDMENKFYCSDLASRAYQSALYPNENRTYPKALNNDGFITSINDIILSKETYLTFYIRIKDDIVHLYYLEDYS